MRLRVSRGLLIIESVLLLLPVTLYSALFGMIIIRSTLNTGGPSYIIPVTCIALLSLLAGWVSVLRFILKGPQSLRGIGSYWFFAASFGVIITILSWLAMPLYPKSQFTVFIFGSPAAVIFSAFATGKIIQKKYPRTRVAFIGMKQ